MIKKIMIIIIVISLLFSPFILINNATATEIVLNTNSEEIPSWSIDNFWKYDIAIEGELSDSVEFNWNFINIVFTVESMDSTYYDISISGTVTGDISLKGPSIIEGTLQDTSITGSMKVEQNNIGIKEIDADINGKLAILGIPLKSFTMDVDIDFTPSYCAIIFPFNQGSKWTSPISYVDGTVDINLLNNPIYIGDVAGGNKLECISVENINTAAGSFNAYKIIAESADISEMYYSSEVGNYVKGFGDFSNVVDIELKSFNYGGTPGAPNKPSRPSGKAKGTPGNTYSYTSSTTDNEGDQIYYWFDWGDGSNSDWLGPYNSGDSITADHKWSSRGTYSVKVKAKDTEEHVSKWSDPLSVSMPKSKNMINIKFFELLQKFFDNHQLIKNLFNT